MCVHCAHVTSALCNFRTSSQHILARAPTTLVVSEQIGISAPVERADLLMFANRLPDTGSKKPTNAFVGKLQSDHFASGLSHSSDLKEHSKASPESYTQSQATPRPALTLQACCSQVTIELVGSHKSRGPCRAESMTLQPRPLRTPYLALNLLRARSLAPKKYRAKTPAIHPAVRPPRRLVPGPMFKLRYIGRENSTAANASVDRAKSLPAKSDAAYCG